MIIRLLVVLFSMEWWSLMKLCNTVIAWRDNGYLLKLDFEKTYDDKVEWECILETLSNRGFGP